MNYRYFTIRRAVRRGFQQLLKRLLRRIERSADFDPLVWAASRGGEMRITVNECTAEWEIHIKLRTNDGMDTYEAYPINEVSVLEAGHRMRDAIDRACLDHCIKHKIYP